MGLGLSDTDWGEVYALSLDSAEHKHHKHTKESSHPLGTLETSKLTWWALVNWNRVVWGCAMI